jgi:glucose/mannose-6-phosphate isomerase
MRQFILDFPKQFGIGFEAAENIKAKEKFDGLVICGMGGSALPAEILKIWLENYKIALPLIIHKNYGLPYNIDKSYLIVCISYSGNTQETLSAFKEAKKKNFSIISITSGGKLAKICQKNKVPLVKIPPGLPPRLAIGLQFSALMKILVNCGIIENELKEILNLKKRLKPKNWENQGKKLAKKLKNKIIFIFSPENLKALSYIWKISFNETSKVISEYGLFPEISHNEIMGFWKVNKKLPSKKFFVIFLKEKIAPSLILKQMKIFESLIKREKIKTETIFIEGKNFLEKIFSNIIFAFWTSYYLALENKVDPLKIELIEEFKRKIAG